MDQATTNLPIENLFPALDQVLLLLLLEVLHVRMDEVQLVQLLLRQQVVLVENHSKAVVVAGY